MARHVPLYRAVLELLRAIASCPSMVPLLLPLSTENGEEDEEQAECQTSVGTLLAKMKTCVDTYTHRLRYWARGSGGLRDTLTTHMSRRHTGPPGREAGSSELRVSSQA